MAIGRVADPKLSDWEWGGPTISIDLAPIEFREYLEFASQTVGGNRVVRLSLEAEVALAKCHFTGDTCAPFRRFLEAHQFRLITPTEPLSLRNFQARLERARKIPDLGKRLYTLADTAVEMVWAGVSFEEVRPLFSEAFALALGAKRDDGETGWWIRDIIFHIPSTALPQSQGRILFEDLMAVASRHELTPNQRSLVRAQTGEAMVRMGLFEDGLRVIDTVQDPHQKAHAIHYFMGEVKNRGWSLEEKERWCLRAHELTPSMPGPVRAQAIQYIVYELSRAALFGPAEEMALTIPLPRRAEAFYLIASKKAETAYRTQDVSLLEGAYLTYLRGVETQEEAIDHYETEEKSEGGLLLSVEIHVPNMNNVPLPPDRKLELLRRFAEQILENADFVLRQFDSSRVIQSGLGLVDAMIRLGASTEEVSRLRARFLDLERRLPEDRRAS